MSRQYEHSREQRKEDKMNGTSAEQPWLRLRIVYHEESSCHNKEGEHKRTLCKLDWSNMFMIQIKLLGLHG